MRYSVPGEPLLLSPVTVRRDANSIFSSGSRGRLVSILLARTAGCSISGGDLGARRGGVAKGTTIWLRHLRRLQRLCT